MPATDYQVSELVQLGNAFTLIHTVAPQRWLSISMVHITNTTNGDLTVRLCYVPTGGTAGADNAMLWDYTVPANDFIEFGGNDKIGPSSMIQALASAAASINIKLAGTESPLVSA